ncbi:MAG: ribokinase [Planctomycetaceae bacterium]
MPRAPRIVVVGSINMDIVVRCDCLPAPGETVLAAESMEIPGGKGANQAVAAARLGAAVQMVGRLGDSFAERLREGLNSEGIDTSSVLATPEVASGIAIIGVESSGQNSIMVVPNANGALTEADVDSVADVIRNADAVLLQLEIPIAAVERAAAIARDAGVPIFLDPAPAPRSLPDTLFQVDVLCPNRSEAAAILGLPIKSIDDAKHAAGMLVSRGAKFGVMTLGGEGAVVCDSSCCEWVRAFPVSAIDTTAAGDAFAAALAVYWCELGCMSQAVRYASAAGAVAASRAGAQPSMPSRHDLELIYRRELS